MVDFRHWDLMLNIVCATFACKIRRIRFLVWNFSARFPWWLQPRVVCRCCDWSLSTYGPLLQYKRWVERWANRVNFQNFYEQSERSDHYFTNVMSQMDAKLHIFSNFPNFFEFFNFLPLHSPKSEDTLDTYSILPFCMFLTLWHF